MDYAIKNRLDYADKLNNREYNITIYFYTKKQMKNKYPNRNYRVIGEVGNFTGVQIGIANNLDGQPLPMYKINTHNKLTEKIIGYAAVDDNIYLAVVKNNLHKRIIILAIFLLLICAGLVLIKNIYHV